MSALNMRSDWFFLVLNHFLTDGSLQSADKDLQESRAVTEKPCSAAVKFNMYQNLHRASHGPPFITVPILTLLFADRDTAIIVNSVKTEITQ